MSYSSSFFRSLAREGVPFSLSSVLLSTRFSPKGGSMEPQEPPTKSATDYNTLTVRVVGKFPTTNNSNDILSLG